jgi:CRISPR-associated protein Csh1
LGFVSAVRDIGRVQIENASVYEDFDWRFLQLPMLPSSDPARTGYVIQVWLAVSDPMAPVLEIQGIERLTIQEYLAGDLPLDEQKRRFCYREPAGSNVSWGYSTLCRLGRPKKDNLGDLVGPKGRIERLRKTMLDDYEKSGVFSKGSVDLIIDQLTQRAEELAELWSDRNQAYILVFGVSHEGCFLYPGEVPAIIQYYRDKLGSKVYDSSFPAFCAVCQKPSEQCVNLDQVFKFATFDKPGYLPGSSTGNKARTKVFPVCLECFSELMIGREHLDTHFCDRRTVGGINIYIVPELITGPRLMNAVANVGVDFIRRGLRREESLFQSLARRNELLVFHFVFWEAKQAQERIHLMVEDVPPSHLKWMENMWLETADVFGITGERRTLDFALKNTVRTILSLAGKSEQDKGVMQVYAISVIGKLLNNEPVETKTIKTLAVSRMSGLVNDSDWLKYAPNNARMLGAVVDFINRCKRRR